QDIDPSSRSRNAPLETFGFDARMMSVLETFLGRPYFQSKSEVGPTDNPLIEAVPLLVSAQNSLAERIYSNLMAQTHLKSLFDLVQGNIDLDTGQVTYDFSAVVSKFKQQLESDSTSTD